jgi:pimeloyl-ACP methyl ester carboxylesterase
MIVGHSMGGLVARLFAEAYRKDVAGMMLVGAPHESGRLGFRGQFIAPRLMAADRPIPPIRKFQDSPPEWPTAAEVDSCRAQAARTARIVRPYDHLRALAQRHRLWALAHPACAVSKDDFIADELAAFFRQRQIDPSPLGDLPLVLVFGFQGLFVPPGVDPAALRRETDSLRIDYARLSRRSRLVIDTLSGHHTQLDNPSLVVGLIRDLLHRTPIAPATP